MRNEKWLIGEARGRLGDRFECARVVGIGSSIFILQFSRWTLDEPIGLKARHVKAWAGASLRAKAQVTGREKSPALKGRNSSRSPDRFALTGLRNYRRNLPGPPLARLASAQALPLRAFSPHESRTEKDASEVKRAKNFDRNWTRTRESQLSTFTIGAILEGQSVRRWVGEKLI
jgi:hypothetical protein